MARRGLWSVKARPKPSDVQLRLAEFRRKAPPLVEEAMRDIALHFLNKLTRERLSSPRTGEPGLRRRTGDTASKGFDFAIEGGTLDGMGLRVFGVLPHLRVQEYGTVGAGGSLPDIVPKRAQFLTIPLEAAMTAAGVARGTAREVGSEYDATFFSEDPSEYTQGATSLILYGVKGGEVVPLFSLVKKVAIPPRLGFFLTWGSYVGEYQKWLGRAIGMALGDSK